MAPPPTHGLSKPTRRIVILEMPILLLTFLALYALTTAQNFSAASDSIQLIYDIDHGEYFSPHHLLYAWFAAVWVHLWRWLGSNADSALIVQLLNGLFGAMTLSVFYFILRTRIQLKRLPAAVATFLPAVSFGFWFYCTTIEVYILPLFFLMVSLALLSSSRSGSDVIMLGGVTHGVAILFHQMSILFLPAAIFALWIKRDGTSLLKRTGCYLLSVAPVVAIPYLIIMLGILKLHTFSKIWYWLTYYSHIGNYWSRLSPTILVKAAIGFGRTIIGGHFLLATSVFQSLARKAVGGRRMMDESFLVHDLSGTLALVLATLAVATICLLMVMICLNIRFWRQVWQQHRVVLGSSLVWLVSFSAFFLFWDTSNIEFWISQSVVFWLVVIALCCHPSSGTDTTRSSTSCLALLAALLLVVNYVGSIQWLMHRDNDYYYVKTQALAPHAARGDLIIIGRWWITEYYLYRFTESEVLSLSRVYSEATEHDAIGMVNDAIQRTRKQGGKVLLSGEAVEPEPETVTALGEGFETFVNDLWSPYRSRWTMFPSDFDTIAILSPD